MLLNLPLDLILNIFYILDNVHDIINITTLNLYLYQNIDDSYFYSWGIKQYTKDFWIKASMRTKSISKPLKTMKLELIRLQRFIDCIKLQNMKWTNKDFYDFWNMLEEEKNRTVKSKYKKNYLHF